MDWVPSVEPPSTTRISANCFWLSHETFKTSSDARCFVKNWKDDADLLGPRLMGDFNTATAGGSDETPNDAKSQEDLQRAE